MEVKKGNLNMLTGSYLNGFAIVNQMIELTFNSNEFEHIKFFVDCEVTSNDEQMNEMRKQLDGIDPDVSPIVLFIKSNIQELINAELKEDTLQLHFANGYCLKFILFSEYGEPLSISIRKNFYDEDYFAIDFNNA